MQFVNFCAKREPPPEAAREEKQKSHPFHGKLREMGDQSVKNLVEFAPAGDAPHVVPPRGIAASAYAKKVPLALFLNAAASGKTQNARQVWNLCANSAQIMRAAECSLFKREPSPRGSRLRACQNDYFDTLTHFTESSVKWVTLFIYRALTSFPAAGTFPPPRSTDRCGAW